MCRSSSGVPPSRDPAGPLRERRARSRVREQDSGGPLLDYLAGRFTYHDRYRWEAFIRRRCVFVNGEPAAGETVLVPGDLLEFRMPREEPEPPVDTGMSVLFEDETILAVNKPADLPCHPGGRYFRNTLWALLLDRVPKGGGLFLLHRLDRETSGVVLAAKTRWAAGSVGRQFQGKRVYKRYLVLVEGAFPHGPLEAEGTLSGDPESAVRKRRRYRPGRPPADQGLNAEPCHTTLTGLGTFGEISLVEALPRTGRRHQIRATLHALGHPVVGDKLYGPDEGIFLRFIQGRMTTEDRRRLRLPRQALHAAELRIRHPATGRGLRLKAALPPDMQAFVKETES